MALTLSPAPADQNLLAPTTDLTAVSTDLPSSPQEAPPAPSTSPVPSSATHSPESSTPAPDFTSIPASSAPIPSMADFGQQEKEQKFKWSIGALDQIDTSVLQADKYFAGKDLSYDPDQKNARLHATNDLFLTMANGGKPIPTDELNRRLLRLSVAHSYFEGRGADSEEGFNAEIVKDATRRKSAKEITSQLISDATTAAIIKEVGEKNQPITYQTWKEKAKTSPGFDSSKEAEYYDAFLTAEQAAKRQISSFGKDLTEMWGALKQGGAGTTSEIGKAIFADLITGDFYNTAEELKKKDAGAIAFGAYDRLNEEQQGSFKDSIYYLVKTLPKKEQRSVLSNLAKSGGRMVDDIGTGIASRFTVKYFEQRMNETLAESAGPWAPLEADRKLAAENAQRIQKDRLTQKNFVDDIRKMEREEYAPLQFYSKESDDLFSLRTLEEAAYAVPGIAAVAGTAMIPVVGGPALYLAMEDFAYRDLRDAAIKAGASEMDASLLADDYKAAVAIPTTALEHLQIFAPLGKLPMVNKVLGAMGDQVKNRFLSGMIKVGATNLAETGVEEFQHLTVYAVQDIVHLAEAFAGDTRTPAAQWYNGKDGALDGFWARQGVTFASMLPLSGFAGSGGHDSQARNRAFTEVSPLQREAFGITPEHSAAIDAARTQGQFSLNEAVEAALTARNPNSDEARAAVDLLIQQHSAETKSTQELQAAGIMPRAVQDTDGTWTVYDTKTGGEITQAPDAASAARIVETHFQGQPLDEALPAITRGEALRIRRDIEVQPKAEISTEGIPTNLKAKEMLQWMKDRDVTGTTHHKDIGVVEIRPRGIKDALGHLLAPKKAAVLLHLKELLPDATLMHVMDQSTKLKSYRLARSLQIEGTHYIARIVIDSDVNGNRYYNHELSDVKELTNHETKSPQALHPGENSKSRQIGREELENTGKLLRWIYSVNENDAETTTQENSISESDVQGNVETQGISNDTTAPGEESDGSTITIHEGGRIPRKKSDKRTYAQKRAIAERILAKITPAQVEHAKGLTAGKAKQNNRAEYLLAENPIATPEERRMVSSPMEIFVSYKPDGSYDQSMIGHQGGTDLPTFWLEDGNSPNGIERIFTHNHPGGRGPSNTDIEVALLYPNSTFRIITKNENKKLELFILKAKTALDREAIKRMTDKYKESCSSRGDTAQIRRKILALFAETHSNIIQIQRRTFN